MRFVGCLPLRAIKIVKGLLATAVAATSLLIVLTSAQPVDANQEDEDQDYVMDVELYCQPLGEEKRYDCYSAWCTWEGSECSFMPYECFDNDGGMC